MGVQPALLQCPQQWRRHAVVMPRTYALWPVDPDVAPGDQPLVLMLVLVLVLAVLLLPLLLSLPVLLLLLQVVQVLLVVVQLLAPLLRLLVLLPVQLSLGQLSVLRSRFRPSSSKL